MPRAARRFWRSANRNFEGADPRFSSRPCIGVRLNFHDRLRDCRFLPECWMNRASPGRAVWSARLIVIVLLGANLTGCALDDEPLKLVKPRLGIDQQLAEDFARLFDEPGRIRIELVDNPNPELPGIEAVKEGFADLALAPNTAAYDPRIEAVVPLYPSVLHIAYRQAEGQGEVENADDAIGDLSERSVFAGPPGAPSRLLLEATAERDGIKPEEINYVQEAESCAEVIVVYTAVLPEVMQAIRGCGEYRLLSLAKPEEIGTGEALDSITLMNPQLKPFVIPAETYDEMTPGPVVTLAVDNLLVASAELDDAVVFDLLGEVLRLKPALSASKPGLFHELTDNFDTSGLSFVMHPGALAYLQRDEPDFYERYSGIAEVVVTLLIGLVSGIYGVWKLYSIRRKNRIDAFCREAITLRDQHLSGDIDGPSLVDALKTLQDQAYGMMIDEHLAADESFRIFIALSNDIIADTTGAVRERHT
ncbi:MAG: hypothetical protein EP301_11265 [Gammaproteobacteria bacterium]|nr:MAG: hypothetical protein EP301_11265 [Gammaproteobacteria bacterium]